MTLQKILITITILCYLTSCQKKEYEYSLSDNQLITILLDLHASEAMTKNFDVTLRDSIGKVYFKQVLQIHEVSEKVFNKDFEELKRNPIKLEMIYKELEDLLEEKKEGTFDKAGRVESLKR